MGVLRFVFNLYVTAVFKEDGTAHGILMKEEIYDLVKIFQISGVSCIPRDIVSPQHVCIHKKCMYLCKRIYFTYLGPLLWFKKYLRADQVARTSLKQFGHAFLPTTITMFHKIDWGTKITAIRLYEHGLLPLPDILDCLEFSECTWHHIYKVWNNTVNVINHSAGIHGHICTLNYDDVLSMPTPIIF